MDFPIFGHFRAIFAYFSVFYRVAAQLCPDSGFSGHRSKMEHSWKKCWKNPGSVAGSHYVREYGVLDIIETVGKSLKIDSESAADSGKSKDSRVDSLCPKKIEARKCPLGKLEEPLRSPAIELCGSGGLANPSGPWGSGNDHRPASGSSLGPDDPHRPGRLGSPTDLRGHGRSSFWSHRAIRF